MLLLYHSYRIERLSVLFVPYMLYLTVNTFSDMSRRFPGLNQYLTEDKVSCLRTQHSVLCESRTRDPSIPNISLYH